MRRRPLRPPALTTHHRFAADGGTKDLSVSHEPAEFYATWSSKMNAMKAYTSGKLKIEGDLMKSQLLEKLFKF